MSDKDKKFKCQVKSKEFDCNVIESADLNSSVNNQIQLTNYPSEKTTTETLKTDKLYAIKISKTDFEQFKTTWTDKKTATPILVLKKDDTTVSLGSIYAGFDNDDGTKKLSILSVKHQKIFQLLVTINATEQHKQHHQQFLIQILSLARYFRLLKMIQMKPQHKIPKFHL